MVEKSFYSRQSLKTAVLLLVFNRPDTTIQVFNAIRNAKPTRLYIAADGARHNKTGEREKVKQVRDFILKNIDWSCQVKTLLREENLGCKQAVSQAITWFFNQEEKGIILEDDCVPHTDFFKFCEKLLDYYEDDQRVWSITGNNFQDGQWYGNTSYYFSKYTHIWGWATWRRAWQYYDVNMSFWPQWVKSKEWKASHSTWGERLYWNKIFQRTFLGKIDTWDFQWLACHWFYNGLVAAPNVNLVSNIGFGDSSTHTVNKNNRHSGLKTNSLLDIKHPSKVIRNIKADEYDFDWHFVGRYLRLPRILYKLPIFIIKMVCIRIKQKINFNKELEN